MKRVSVVGGAGSGKFLLAARIAQTLGVPYDGDVAFTPVSTEWPFISVAGIAQ